MVNLVPIPSVAEIHKASIKVPPYRNPSTVPYAYVAEEYLTAQQCNDILAEGHQVEPYEFPHCGAITREWSHEVLDPIEECARTINKAWFEFDLNDYTKSWMQTYVKGGGYQLHMDGEIGQTRKLTAVAMLSHHEDYNGGILKVLPVPYSYNIPRTRGTIVVFPSWLIHEVTEITYGTRETINMGFWGPPFR